ncbi:regulatory iron-sulfur-containing complex subunit RicT [Desulfovibrio psychrotolerans]|uniref:PSP1 C-terminal domain-containing protein n=1 Tax=Desulfovibrio psychrotolerans TaxID=415242 RepID=A0A7J0BWB0_9BACT|nr:regulatory iron-sulfur-containing complex subunit RicT [Desulfovibrio psychrotolerans]GFM37451.1 hypothetical protein DSM19430T_21350 [Desulfovibrio psychrotolerans]
MALILGIKFREYGQIYYFEKSSFEVNVGDRVIVKTEQGQGLGKVVSEHEVLPDDAEVDEIKPVHRLAVSEDLEREQENELLAREARQYCVDCIRSRKLEMKLVDVEVYFDRSKIVFYFTAPARIDFRELVKDLVKTYRTRIELRQIGVRHETQMIGAVGNCGMVCCCRQFLRTFAPVTIKMAKEQNLFLNPAKISGICGRLLCCLSYEQHNYEEFHRACPKLGKKYQTKEGAVKVLRANMFRNSIAVLTEANEEKEFTLEEWETLKPSRPDQAKQDAARAAAKRAIVEGAERDAGETGSGSDIPASQELSSGPARGGIVLPQYAVVSGAVQGDDGEPVFAMGPEDAEPVEALLGEEADVVAQAEFGPEDIIGELDGQAVAAVLPVRSEEAGVPSFSAGPARTGLPPFITAGLDSDGEDEEVPADAGGAPSVAHGDARMAPDEAQAGQAYAEPSEPAAPERALSSDATAEQVQAVAGESFARSVQVGDSGVSGEPLGSGGSGGSGEPVEPEQQNQPDQPAHNPKIARLTPLRKPVKSAEPGSRKTSRGRRKRKRKPAGEDA